jgi:hypothetical protein
MTQESIGSYLKVKEIRNSLIFGEIKWIIEANPKIQNINYLKKYSSETPQKLTDDSYNPLDGLNSSLFIFKKENYN